MLLYDERWRYGVQLHTAILVYIVCFGKGLELLIKGALHMYSHYPRSTKDVSRCGCLYMTHMKRPVVEGVPKLGL